MSKLGFYELYILPCNEDLEFGLATVLYKRKEPNMSPSEKFKGFEITPAEISSPRFLAGEVALPITDLIEDRISAGQQHAEVTRDHSSDLKAKVGIRLGNSVGGPSGSFERNYVMTHPRYLKTLGQAHSSWIFGAMAELVDNSRDAKATKLEVAIDMVYSKSSGKYIPMLSVIDDGHGMTHADIQRMMSFGHGQAEAANPNCIGRYGIGFKNLEIPIVSYKRVGQLMEVDTDIQNEDSAKYNLKVIKKFSLFDKYFIGEKAGIFKENGTGTQIYIWNLDQWGSSYSLQWEAGITGGSSFHQGGIFICSRRIRSRPGQISCVVPLDYSLTSYLEVIFLDPRMKIYVQGALFFDYLVYKLGQHLQFKSLFAKDRTKMVMKDDNLQSIASLSTSTSMLAYKRVGSMIHNGDCGRGIIGVIEVGDLMDDNNGHVWVHNSKQGFQDSEAYAELEKWLGEKADQYIDKYVDKIQLRKGNAQYKPDHEWVQCDKCRKWRMLSSDFDSRKLPPEWFCYMKPFNGSCEIPEEEVERGLITISARCNGHVYKNPTESRSSLPKKGTNSSSGSSDDTSGKSRENAQLPLKRRRTSILRSCKKN